MRVFYNSVKSPAIRQIDSIRPGSWVHVESPSDEDLEKLSKDLKLDLDLLKDGVDVNESPRIEKEGQATYIFTRYSLPETEKLTTSPLLIIYTEEMVVTICRLPFGGLDRLIEQGIFTSKRAQLVLAILTEINIGFKRRINSVNRRILQIRAQLNRQQIDNKDFIGFIDIEEDLNDFLLVLEPMRAVLNNLLNGRYMRLYEDDKDLIEDLSLGTTELTQLATSLLATIRNVREAYSTITANNLNKVFKLMTSVTILLSIFTLVTGFYSMNIQLPFAENPGAFWVILVFTATIIGFVAYLFRRKRWF